MERVDLTPDLVERYDRPGPRYTSYPPAVHFDVAVDASVYEDHLGRACERASEPLSVYIHLPFCDQRCSFCGCHAVIARDRRVSEVYLDHLIAEIGLVGEHLGDRKTVTQYHWGGGTPTFYDSDALRTLHTAFVDQFELADDAERAIEVDPRVTSAEQLETLCELGFNRISIGVQDVDPAVQEAIGRVQAAADVEAVITDSRRLGFESVNVDLIYGLPHQTPETFAATMETVLAWRPDRMAIYGFAYVPWVRRHQKRIDASLLPDADVRLELIVTAGAMARSDGYVGIGIDHFALPDDELVRAREAGRLHRNFMGYTVSRAPDMIGFGVSAIGDVDGALVQNTSRLRSYYDAVASGTMAVERGYVRDVDDRLRGHVITELMCNLRVDWSNVAERFDIDPVSYFAAELARMETDADLRALAAVDEGGVELTPLGALFGRNVAMVFDAHLSSDGAAEAQRYSRTV